MKVGKVILILLVLMILLSNICFATDTIENIENSTDEQIVNEINLEDINLEDIISNGNNTNFILICILEYMFLSEVLRFRK